VRKLIYFPQSETFYTIPAKTSRAAHTNQDFKTLIAASPLAACREKRDIKSAAQTLINFTMRASDSHSKASQRRNIFRVTTFGP